MLVDLAHQFELFMRNARWRGMLEPLDSIVTVHLHHPIQLDEREVATFDVATFDGAGAAIHLARRVAQGTREAVEGFIGKVIAAKRSPGAARTVAGAVLVATSFSDDGVEAYLEALREARGGALRSAMGLLSHREGFLATGGGGVHILLVEERDGRRRPLVPEQ